MKKEENLSSITMIVFIVMSFVLSMSSILFNSILDKIALDLHIPLARTANLTSFYAYGAGLGTPLFLILFRKFNKTILLKTMLFLNIITTSLSIIISNFNFLLLTRFLMGLTGNCYNVLAISFIALSNKNKVGQNLALLIAGNAIALMLGIPLTRSLTDLFSWQYIFLILIILMMFSLFHFTLHLHSFKQETTPLHLKHELHLLKEQNIAIVLIVSLIIFIGYGAFYTYLTPYIIELFPSIDMYMGLFLVIIGFCSFSGNLLGGIICDRIGYYKALCLSITLQILLSICIYLSQNILVIQLLLICIWMINAWFIGLQLNTGIAVVSNNQSNLIISLNNSCIQLGQAIGTSIISLIISNYSIVCIIFVPIFTAVIVLILLLFNYKHVKGGVTNNDF